MNEPRSTSLRIGTREVIEDILSESPEYDTTYRRYLYRTSWRVEADFDFLSREAPKVESVLEIGAAPPLLIGLMHRAGVNNLTAMDPQIERFSAYLSKRDIAALQVNLLSDNLPDMVEAFQLVCLCEVIEHLPGDVLGILSEVGNWVAPGGYIYLTTPNLRSVTGVVGLCLRGSGLASKSKEPVTKQYSGNPKRYGYLGHLREFTEKEVTDLMREAGFKHVNSSYQVRPRTATFLDKTINALESVIPTWRLFGKYLYRKNA